MRILQAISAEEKKRIEKKREERLTPSVDLWPFKGCVDSMTTCLEFLVPQNLKMGSYQASQWVLAITLS